MGDRYRFYFTPDSKVICTSVYGDKTVRATAKCADADEYDKDKGQALAQLKVDKKVAELRIKRANQKVVEAYEAYDKAKKQYLDMEKYLDDALQKYTKTVEELDKLLELY